MSNNVVNITGNNTPPAGPEMTVYSYAVTYKSKYDGEAYTVEVSGYPLVMGGFLNFMKFDANNNAYSDFLIPTESIVIIKRVKDEDGEKTV